MARPISPDPDTVGRAASGPAALCARATVVGSRGALLCQHRRQVGRQRPARDAKHPMQQHGVLDDCSARNTLLTGPSRSSSTPPCPRLPCPCTSRFVRIRRAKSLGSSCCRLVNKQRQAQPGPEEHLCTCRQPTSSRQPLLCSDTHIQSSHLAQQIIQRCRTVVARQASYLSRPLPQLGSPTAAASSQTWSLQGLGAAKGAACRALGSCC